MFFKLVAKILNLVIFLLEVPLEINLNY